MTREVLVQFSDLLRMNHSAAVWRRDGPSKAPNLHHHCLSLPFLLELSRPLLWPCVPVPFLSVA